MLEKSRWGSVILKYISALKLTDEMNETHVNCLADETFTFTSSLVGRCHATKQRTHNAQKKKNQWIWVRTQEKTKGQEGKLYR